MPRVSRVTALTLSVLVCLVATAGSVVAAHAANADVSVDIQDGSGAAGQSLSYSLPVFNAGPALATGVVLTVQLPSGLDLVSGSSGCTRTGSTLSCSLGSIPAGQGAVLLWELRGAEPGTYVIAGSVTANEPDPISTNNSDSAQIVVAPSDADVSIDLQNASGTAGATFFWGFGVANAGPGTAANVVATLELPTGIELVSGSGCTQSGQTLTCPFGSIGAGRGLGTILQLRATNGGTYTISGSVTADTPDGAPANNTDSGTISITASADVDVAVTDSMNPVKPGQGVTYTTIVTNNGPSTATNVTLSETWSMSSAKDLSAGGVTTSQGACTLVGMRLDCQFGTLTSGASATVTVSVKPRGGGTLTMTANTSATEPDPDGGNNSATETTTVGPK